MIPPLNEVLRWHKKLCPVCKTSPCSELYEIITDYRDLYPVSWMTELIRDEQ